MVRYYLCEECGHIASKLLFKPNKKDNYPGAGYTRSCPNCGYTARSQEFVKAYNRECMRRGDEIIRSEFKSDAETS